MEPADIARSFYERLRELPSWKHKQAMLDVAGYPHPGTEREVELIERVLRKALYPGRSGGIH